MGWSMRDPPLVWGTEEFYSTSAQILPTLLVAIAVEAGLLLQRRPHDIAGEHLLDADFPSRYPRLEALQDRVVDLPRFISLPLFMALGVPLYGVAAIVGGSFLVGELAALLMVFSGMPAWLSFIAAPLVWWALLVTMVCAVTIPVLRWVDVALAQVRADHAAKTGPAAQSGRSEDADDPDPQP